MMPAGFDLVVLGRKEKDMVTASGRNPDRREEDVDAEGNPTNMIYDPHAPAPSGADTIPQELQAPPPQSYEDAPPESSEVGELRPLQEAQMAVEEAPMDDGGAPDAPMAPADMGAPASEALGESESVVEVDSSLAPPIDPSITEAGPSAAAAV